MLKHKASIGAAAFVAAFAIASTNARAAGVDDGSLFETEGNAIDQPVNGADDWANIDANNDESIADTGILGDDDEADDIYTGGGSKDDLDIPSWQWKFAKPTPDKDNITHAYAASYDNGHLIVYFGADRFANNGAADIGFWFFQSEITKDTSGNGKFIGEHRNGDLLVLANFTRGGAVSSIEVWQWAKNAGTDGNINLKKLTGLNAGECLDANIANKKVCAISNHGSVSSPWDYTPKSGSADIFPNNSFFEGGIDLTAIFGENSVPCFASFLAETRSSTSVDAVLKDFDLGSFPNCSVDIDATCTDAAVNSNQTGYDYTYDTTVTNDGFGPLVSLDVYRIIGQDDHLEPSDPDADEFIGTIASLAGGASSSFLDETFSSTINPESVATRVEARTNAGLPPNVFGQVAVPGDSCDEAPLSPAINVDKDCDTAIEALNDTVVVRVDFSGTVCNTGTAILTGVTASDDHAGALDLTINSTTAKSVNIGIGKCATYTGSYYPDETSTNVPGAAFFTDTVTASGTGALGSGTAEDEESATCSLCPGEEELCEQP
jgi:hypothetical protein